MIPGSHSSSGNNNNTPLRHRSNNNTTNHESSSSSSSTSQNASSSLDRIDVDSLRRVFGEEDFTKRKPHELRELWMERVKDDDVPPFLLDPKDKHHVAPHIMAMQLLLKRRSHKSGDGLYYDRVPTATNDEEHDPRQTRHPASIPRVLLVPLAVIALICATCQFVLEVLGGAGAIWGCAELVGLRKGGPLHESWTSFQKLALGVGFACLLRFVLVHCLRPASSPTFVQAHKIIPAQHKGSLFLFLELAQLVAKDPILFLHPTKGPILSCCGCVCECCGTRCGVSRCGVSRQDDSIDLGLPSSKPSPQRSTWSLSSDEDNDNDNDNAMDRV